MQEFTPAAGKNEINVRQICFILIAFNVCGKILLFPTNLSYYGGNGVWFSAFLDFALHTVAVWAVAYACSKSDKTFFERLKLTFGEMPAKIIMGLFALIFLASSLVPLGEQKLYVQEIFYDTIPSLITFLPFFVFSTYATQKRFSNTGRAADLCFPIFCVCFILLVIMALGEVNLTHLLPVFNVPFKNVLKGAASSLFRFNEAAVLLMFMGHFKYKKGDCTKITVSYGIGGLSVTLFCALFYSVYSTITPDQFFAISKISVFFSAINTVGRVDLILLYALEIVMLFAVVLNLQMCRYCLEKATGYNNNLVLSVAINAVLLILTIIFDHKFTALQKLFGGPFGIVLFVMSSVLPALSLTLKKGGKSK